MSFLADIPELVGFFSYSREDDADSNGALSALRSRIQGELRGQLGRTARTFRLWQDKEAIPSGTLWETEIKHAVEQSVFFIPIITPTVVASPYCRFELDAFLAREAALGRSDLVFPILYIHVPALEDSVRRQNDAVLSLIAKRQYVDWRRLRHRDVRTTEVSEEVERFCTHIREALHRPWISPEERKQQDEAETQRQAEDEARRKAAQEERLNCEAELEQRGKEEADAKRRAGDAHRQAEQEKAHERSEKGRRMREAEAEQKRADRQKAENERRRQEADEKRLADTEERLPPAPPPPRPAWPKSRPALLIGSLVGVVVLAGIGLWLAAQPSPVTVTPAPAPAPAPVVSAPAAAPPAPGASTSAAVEPPPAATVTPTRNDIFALSLERERALKPKDTFSECTRCPDMVVVPTGSFIMGSPVSERGRNEYEAPQHRVTFTRQFAAGKFAVTVDQFAAFAQETGYDTGLACDIYADGSWEKRSGRSWRNPDFAQVSSQPVVCVGWDDAQAYVAWLSRMTGKNYRLLSEAEREYVTRAGTTTPFWWGSSISTSQAAYDGNHTYGGGSTGEFRKGTMPVDSFQANPWGLYQVHGNVWEWTEDCWNEKYYGAPADGSPWTGGDCNVRIIRGGSWDSDPMFLRSAYRVARPDIAWRINDLGFRVARALMP
jgi:formylglycine-generating enzyme required for sulfatase activity